MKILDIDLDYFLKVEVRNIGESVTRRLDEVYDKYIWNESEVRAFLENNLGLSTLKKIQGRVVKGHNEALFFWQELVEKEQLTAPFDVIHVDSHADLGLGYLSWSHICSNLLRYPVEERPAHAEYEGFGKLNKEGIGDYLLYAIAYRMISFLVYCGNPYCESNDYLVPTLKDFKENYVNKAGDPIMNTIQLLYNPRQFPKFNANNFEKKQFIEDSIKEPEVPFLIIPRSTDVHFNGDFDFAVMAQSPNYTPQSADYIIDVFREYIEEI